MDFIPQKSLKLYYHFGVYTKSGKYPFECEYRATRREEMTNLFIKSGCKNVLWLFPKETGFYQPIVIAKK